MRDMFSLSLAEIAEKSVSSCGYNSLRWASGIVGMVIACSFEKTLATDESKLVKLAFEKHSDHLCEKYLFRCLC